MSQMLAQLHDRLQSIRVRPLLLSQIVVAEAANQRAPAGHTKTRAMVRGGGRKPWRQKGTGRARHGSTRSPLWIGGGSVFGPRPERNFFRGTTKKMRQRAFQMALAVAIHDERLRLLEDQTLSDAKTTKQLLSALGDHFVMNQRNLLLVVSLENPAVQVGQNLAHLLIRTAQSVRITDLLTADRIILTEEAVTILRERAFDSTAISAMPVTSDQESKKVAA